MLRLWEIAGRPGAVKVTFPAPVRVSLVDLLERDVRGLAVKAGTCTVPVRPRGFASVRFRLQRP